MKAICKATIIAIRQANYISKELLLAVVCCWHRLNYFKSLLYLSFKSLWSTLLSERNILLFSQKNFITYILCIVLWLFEGEKNSRLNQSRQEPALWYFPWLFRYFCLFIWTSKSIPTHIMNNKMLIEKWGKLYCFAIHIESFIMSCNTIKL